MDRIYVTSSKYESKFKKYAEEQGWLYRKSTTVAVDTDKQHLYLDNITIKGITHLPYADTFKKLYYKDGLLTASSTSIPKGFTVADDYVYLENIDEYGYCRRLDPNAIQEAFTGVWRSKKDCIKIKRYANHPKNPRYSDYVFKAHIVDINGTYYSQCDTDSVQETSLDGWALRSTVVEEVITNDTMDKTKGRYIKDYGWVHNNNVIKLNDKYYHKKDNNIVEYQGKYYTIFQCYQNYTLEEENIGNETYGKTLEITAEKYGTPIPAEHVLIMYDLKIDKLTKELQWVPRYVTPGETKHLELTTGEYILDNTENRKYLKRWNKKWYLKSNFEMPDKNQLLLFA